MDIYTCIYIYTYEFLFQSSLALTTANIGAVLPAYLQKKINKILTFYFSTMYVCSSVCVNVLTVTL